MEASNIYPSNFGYYVLVYKKCLDQFSLKDIIKRQGLRLLVKRGLEPLFIPADELQKNVNPRTGEINLNAFNLANPICYPSKRSKYTVALVTKEKIAEYGFTI